VTENEFSEWLQNELLDTRNWSRGKGLADSAGRCVHTPTGNELEYCEKHLVDRDRRRGLCSSRSSKLTFGGEKIPFPVSEEWTVHQLNTIHKEIRKRTLLDLTQPKEADNANG
jgi:hypothetical protein